MCPRSLLQLSSLVLTAAGLIAPARGEEVPRLSALAGEDSPHLRQYIDSPVNWRPWGPAAFAEAERDAKPLFVSIGYFSCNWCALMEREAFRNPATVKLMNENFVNVKVDRFERPDLDRLYLRFVEERSRRSGWPLNVWMTPDRVPLRGVTYMPVTDDGHGTFGEFVLHTARWWDEENVLLRSQAPAEVKKLGEVIQPTPPAGFSLSSSVLDLAFSQIAGQFDPGNGGFVKVPKFPSPARLEFLRRHWAAEKPESTVAGECVEMVETTLRGMARGGLRDQLGGGFFRYALDEAWRRPYFEKMALDQALMVQSYLSGYLLTGHDEHALVARETLTYVDRELSHPEGGFCNAEHSQSLPDARATAPVEGAYYVWDHRRLREAGGAAADLLEQVFDVRARGNIPPGTDPFTNLEGLNLLSEARPLGEAARRLGLSNMQAATLLGEGRAALWQARLDRPRPARDDLLITQMNGALISAFARAAMVLGDDALLARAQRCAHFVKGRLWQEGSQTLYRCCTDRSPKYFACAEDYAFLISGVLDLYEATGDRAWIEWAENLQRAFDLHHRDAEAGGYFDARRGLPDVALFLKSADDSSNLSGNSVAGVNLIRWAVLLSRPDRDTEARRLLGSVSTRLASSPGTVPGLAAVAHAVLHPPGRIMLVGPASTPEMTAARRQIWSCPGRRPSIVQIDSDEARAWLTDRQALPPAVLPNTGGSPAAFVLEDGKIKVGPLPLTDLPKHLASRPRPPS